MTRRSQAEWRELFREQDSSGLDAAAFCRSLWVCPKYLSLWAAVVEGRVSDDTAAVAAFVPVAAQTAAVCCPEIDARCDRHAGVISCVRKFR